MLLGVSLCLSKDISHLGLVIVKVVCVDSKLVKHLLLLVLKHNHVVRQSL